nr:carnitine O-acetyltransferase isoform X2 [Parasteatoda tepidariorum]
MKNLKTHIVKEFGAPDGLGVKLHAALVDKSNKTENWIREWWINEAYLSVRDSLLTGSSMAVMGEFQDFNTDESHLRFSAKVVAAMLNLKSQFDNSTLEKEVIGGHPLDMTNYCDMFAGCRIPNSPRDSIFLSYLEDEPQNHIVVAHKNHYFSCKVYGDDGEPLHEDQIYSQLKKVVDQSQEPQLPIGILTTLHRDKWLKAYNTLRKYDPINKKSINAIQKALFILCLDKPVSNKDMPNRKSHMISHFIHGGGTDINSGNRWFDEFQIIVNRDGTFGFNFEHSIIDGQFFRRLLQHVFDYTNRSESNKHCHSTSAPDPNMLKFNVSRETVEDIEDAKRDLKRFVDDLDMRCMHFDNYGTDFMKSHKLSSDSFIQMALQLAFYKIHGEIGATYESASTRKFLFGRTDVIRSTSVESVDFCRKMLDKSTSLTSKIAFLRNAIQTHKEYALQAVNGMAFDRLLLGLRLIAKESGMDEPVLFQDVAFIRSTYYRLSTSNIAIRARNCGGFPVLVPDGYACAYNPKPSFLTCVISASNTCPKTSSDDFETAMTEALTEMHSVITKSSV